MVPSSFYKFAALTSGAVMLFASLQFSGLLHAQDLSATSATIDDGDAGFSVNSMGWSSRQNGLWYGGDYMVGEFILPKTEGPFIEPLRATYAFTNLQQGTYNVYATWFPEMSELNSPRSKAVTFTLVGDHITQETVNQQQSAKQDMSVDNRPWQLIGQATTVDGHISVIINGANYIVADAVRVVKTQAPGSLCGNGILDPGEECDPGGNMMDCSSTCHYTYKSSASSSSQAPTNGPADLSLSITGDATVAPGGIAHYALTAKNLSSTVPAQNVSIFASIPPGASLTNGLMPGCSLIPSGISRIGYMQCLLGTLAPNRAQQLSLTFTLSLYNQPYFAYPQVGAVQSTTPDPNKINNTAMMKTLVIYPVGSSSSAASSDGTNLCGNGVVNPGEQCDDGNKIDTDGCSNLCRVNGECFSPPCIQMAADVSVKLQSDTSVLIGQPLSLTVTTRNDGGAAKNVVTTVSFPTSSWWIVTNVADLDLSICKLLRDDHNFLKVMCSYGDLPSGTEKKLLLKLQANDSSTCGTTLPMNATVTTDTPDNNQANNRTSQQVTATCPTPQSILTISPADAMQDWEPRGLALAGGAPTDALALVFRSEKGISLVRTLVLHAVGTPSSIDRLELFEWGQGTVPLATATTTCTGRANIVGQQGTPFCATFDPPLRIVPGSNRTFMVRTRLKNDEQGAVRGEHLLLFLSGTLQPPPGPVPAPPIDVTDENGSPLPSPQIIVQANAQSGIQGIDRTVVFANFSTIANESGETSMTPVGQWGTHVLSRFTATAASDTNTKNGRDAVRFRSLSFKVTFLAGSVRSDQFTLANVLDISQSVPCSTRVVNSTESSMSITCPIPAGNALFVVPPGTSATFALAGRVVPARENLPFTAGLEGFKSGNTDPYGAELSDLWSVWEDFDSVGSSPHSFLDFSAPSSQ